MGSDYKEHKTNTISMTISKTPKLSIVMPFFNQKDMVADMIESILANDFQDWELIAVDDGSEKECIESLRIYGEDPRIRFISRTISPKGAQTCRNIGLDQANGDYIVFFDSDDHITPNCLKNRVETFEKRPDLDFMVFPSGSYDGKVFSETGSYLFGYPIFRDDLKAFIQHTLPFTVWTNIYRTEALREKLLSWDTNLLSYQDSDFNIQVLIHGLRYDYAASRPDYGYRTGNNVGSISKKVSSIAHRQSLIYFIDKQYQVIQHAYGRCYDQALYQCALYIYAYCMSDGIDADFARQITRTVQKHDKMHGLFLFCKVSASLFLQIMLPAKLSRQLPMPMFLVRKLLMEKFIIPKRIKKFLS